MTRDHAGDCGSDGADAQQRGGGHGHHHAALQVDIFRYIYKISTARPTSAGARARVWAAWW